MTADSLRRQQIYKLGQRALDYYKDTGFCVFCEADDCKDISHGDHCNVGKLSDIVVDETRKKAKAFERGLVDGSVVQKLVDGGFIERG